MVKKITLEEEIKEIEEIETKIQKEIYHEKKTHLLYFLITRKRNSVYEKIRNSMYVDIKKFVHSYISFIDEKQFGYDEINLEKITDLIDSLRDLKNQYKLLLFTCRKLNKKGFENEADIIKLKANKLKGKILLTEGKWVRAFIHQCSFSLTSILITLFILFFICVIVLLPAPCSFMEVFDVSYEDYSSNFLLNHVLNIFSSLPSISSKFKVTTNSVIGLLSLSFFKIIHFIFIVNFLFEKIKTFMNNN